MSTPKLNACLIVISRPNSRNATKIDSSVKMVRTFFRHRLLHSNGQVLHAAASVEQHALLEMQRALGALGGARVVRDHDDRLAVLLVERGEQVEDLVAGLAIEIAGGLVAEQQRRVGDDRPGDADALLLAARELPRIVLGALGQPDDVQRDRHPLLALGLRQVGEQQRQVDVALGGEHRQQVVELEHEADVVRRASARAVRPTAPRCWCRPPPPIRPTACRGRPAG